MSAFKRILLKLSGEALQGSHAFGIDPVEVSRICQEIVEVHSHGVQIGLVVGGGNIFRGKEIVNQLGVEAASADNMGMLATVINCLALQAALEKLGLETRSDGHTHGSGGRTAYPPAGHPAPRERAGSAVRRWNGQSFLHH